MTDFKDIRFFRFERAGDRAAVEDDQAIAEGDQKVLNHAIRLTLGHFAEEEKDVFPLLEKELTKNQLAQLGMDWAQLRGIKL